MEKTAGSPANIRHTQRRLPLKFAGCFVPLLLLAILIVAPLAWRRVVRWTYDRHTYSLEETPSQQTAVVFGAAVYGNGRLSTVLRDRMDTAVALYHAGKVNKLLVSGDNASQFYDEPGAMMEYAVQQGVSRADIQVDHAGRRTYDTCFRSREVFELDKAILVTQQFHLPRALFTCRQLGIEASGVPADRRSYRASSWYEFRETAATLNALWDIVQRRPPPSQENDTQPLAH